MWKGESRRFGSTCRTSTGCWSTWTLRPERLRLRRCRSRPTWRFEMVRRGVALFSVLVVMVVASIAWAVAAPAYAAPTQAPAGACSIEEWQSDLKGCVDRLEKVASSRVDCLDPPTPSTPDSGLAG